jgi:hypothetical protein
MTMFEWFRNLRALNGDYKQAPKKERWETVITKTVGPGGKVNVSAELILTLQQQEEVHYNFGTMGFSGHQGTECEKFNSPEAVRRYIKNLRALIPECEKLAAKMDAELGPS